MKRHIPVMGREICDFMPAHARIIVDGTFGHAGHTEQMLLYAKEHKYPVETIHGFDIDNQVLANAHIWMESIESQGLLDNVSLVIHQKSYEEIRQTLLSQGQLADYIILDLGINREHIRDSDRGFSYKNDGPLDMRFDKNRPQTAFACIQVAHLDQMCDRFMMYGDFGPKRALMIAKCLSKNKRNELLKTTSGLKKLLMQHTLGQKEIVRVFQSLRIHTNDEFGVLIRTLETLPYCLAEKGRCAIMTYHSGEERIVKNVARKLAGSGCVLLPSITKASTKEVATNKAARSAKTRIIEKI